MASIEKRLLKFWYDELPGLYATGQIAWEEDLRLRLASALLDTANTLGLNVFCEPRWVYPNSLQRPDVVVARRGAGQGAAVEWVIELKFTPHYFSRKVVEDLQSDLQKLRGLQTRGMHRERRHETGTTLYLAPESGKIGCGDGRPPAFVSGATRYVLAAVGHHKTPWAILDHQGILLFHAHWDSVSETLEVGERGR